MIHSESVPQQRAVRLAQVQKFDSVFACGKEHVVLKKPALLLREQSDEHGRRWCHMKEHLQSLRECVPVERKGDGSTLPCCKFRPVDPGSCGAVTRWLTLPMREWSYLLEGR